MTKRQFGMRGWKPEQLGDLSGKNYVITGGNSGIGLEAARMLGDKGARVTIACRNEDKAREAVSELKQKAPSGAYDYALMDLASLASVRDGASQIRATRDRIDGLINNAGIMMIPARELTVDGFETQFGVNHLGHFVLDAALCDLVEAASGRFVSVASIAHKYAPGFKFDDLMLERGYTPTKAYAQSKLANLVYALELNRRLEKSGAKSSSFACHPGWSSTNLQTTGPGAIAGLVLTLANALFAQPAAKGAIPTVLCAAGDDAEAGGYYGPTQFRDFKGPVDRASMTRAAKDEAAAKRLWDESEKLTGAKWSIL